MKNRYWLGWGLFMMGASALSARVDPQSYSGGRFRDDQQRIQRNSSALATMLGEFRTSVSDIMFIKTERYLHGGIGYIPHHAESALSAGDLAAEVDEHQSELGAHDDPVHDPMSHAGTPTLIPTPDRDFRGWIGTLHRAVKPWRDPDRPHIHTDGRELLPWFRLMTRADPHYVRGYVAGAFWLQQQDEELAIQFLNEGIYHNPGAFELFVSRGLLRVRQARQSGDTQHIDPASPIATLLRTAREDFLRAAELGLQQRPDDVDADGFGADGWVAYQENDLLAACRMTLLLTERLDGAAAAAPYAQRFQPILEFTP
jgi:hypothetical protein